MRRFHWIVVGILITAGVSFAQVSGTVWESTPSDMANDPANMSSSLAHANFTSSGINYCASWSSGCPATPYTVGAFLNNPTFTGAMNGFSAGASMAAGTGNTEAQLTGTILLAAGANMFDIAHDDGLTLSLSGGPGTTTCSIQMGTLCVDQPGPTAPAMTPFTITASAAGTYNFTLDYNECCTAPAVLQWTFTNGTPVGTPEPGSIALLGTALCGAVLLLKRRRKT